MTRICREEESGLAFQVPSAGVQKSGAKAICSSGAKQCRAGALAELRALLLRHLLAFLTRLGQADRNRLLAALDSAAPAASAASRGAAFITMHLALHIASRTAGISAFPSLGHA